MFSCHLFKSIIIVGICLSILGLPGELFGQSREEQISELYAKSREAYENKEYNLAASLLEKAYKLDPQPIFAHNIARTYEQAGKYQEALKWFEVCVLGDSDDKLRQMSLEGISRIEKNLMAVEKALQEKESVISVNSDPVGAEVYLDEGFLGQTPYRQAFPPGTYTLKIVLKGYDDIVRQIQLRPGFELNYDFILATVEEKLLELPKLVVTVNPEPSYAVPGLVSFGVGALGLVGGIVFGVLTDRTFDRANSVEVRSDATKLNHEKERGNTFKTTSLVMYGIGVIGLGTSLVFLLLQLSIESDPEESVSKPGISIGPAKLSFGLFGGQLSFSF